MHLCVSCSKNCSENDSVTCDICKKSVHVNCAGLSKNEVDCLRSKRRKIHFYCDRCDIVDTVLKLKEEVELLKKNLNECKNAISTDSAISNRSDNFSFDDVLTEFEDRNSRASNLIIYGLPESLNNDVNDRKQDDETRCKELLGSVVDNNLFSFASCHRLGKVNAGGVRPIKLCFESRDVVNRILRMYRPLNNVYMNRDLTARQRDINYRIRQEYQRRVKDGETDIKLKYRNGIPSIVRMPSTTSKNV